MNQKLVSFKVAKAIKEAGYPQGDKDGGNCNVYPLEDHNVNFSAYTRVGELSTRYHCQNWNIPYVFAPTYLDVWLWLWTNKNIHLIPVEMRDVGWRDTGEVNVMYNGRGFVRATPEEAIAAAIEYLVDNDLIK